MFTTAADFNVIPYSIPNLAGSGPINTFNTYVDEHEEDILKSLLGKTLYDAFIAGLDEDYPEQRWVDLRDGATYVHQYKTYEWVGMKKMLKPFIFQSWLTDTFDNNSGIGVVVAKAENAKVINPGNRISRAYNEFSRIAGNPPECDAKLNTLYGYLNIEGAEGTFDDSFDFSFQTFGDYFKYVWTSPGRKNTFQL